VHGIEDYTYPEQIPDALVKVPGMGEFAMDELEVRYLFTDSEDIVRGLVQESEDLLASHPQRASFRRRSKSATQNSW
jgi:hypothetical protein